VCVENDRDGDQRYRGVSDGRDGAGHGACRDGRAQHRGPGAAPSLRRWYDIIICNRGRRTQRPAASEYALL